MYTSSNFCIFFYLNIKISKLWKNVFFLIRFELHILIEFFFALATFWLYCLSPIVKNCYWRCVHNLKWLGSKAKTFLIFEYWHLVFVWWFPCEVRVFILGQRVFLFAASNSKEGENSPVELPTIELSNDSNESTDKKPLISGSESLTTTATTTTPATSTPPARIYLKKDLANPDNLQPEMLMRFRDVLPDMERNGVGEGLTGSASDNDAPQDWHLTIVSERFLYNTQKDVWNQKFRCLHDLRPHLFTPQKNDVVVKWIFELDDGVCWLFILICFFGFCFLGFCGEHQSSDLYIRCFLTQNKMYSLLGKFIPFRINDGVSYHGLYPPPCDKCWFFFSDVVILDRFKIHVYCSCSVFLACNKQKSYHRCTLYVSSTWRIIPQNLYKAALMRTVHIY